jgi:hypothetical protein
MAATLTRDGEITYVSFPIEKTETDANGDVIVYGRATDGSLDSDEQIIDPDFAAKAVQEWLADGANIRVQHNPQRDPAGVGIQADTDDAGATWVKGRIVEPIAQKLVNAGALRAYSVGIARPVIKRDSVARGGRITDGKVVEISLVDRPANKNCGIQLVKAAADGTPEYTGKVFGDDDLIRKAAGMTAIAEEMVSIQLPADVTVAFTPSDLARITKSKSPNVGEDATAGGVDRDSMPDADFAGRGRSFPIHSPGDVADAAQSIGRAGDDNYSSDTLQQNITEIAHRKGPEYVAQLPDSWKAGDDDTAAKSQLIKSKKDDDGSSDDAGSSGDNDDNGTDDGDDSKSKDDGDGASSSGDDSSDDNGDDGDNSSGDDDSDGKTEKAESMGKTCDLCDGSGKIREGHVKCPRCHGDGTIAPSEPDEHGDDQSSKTVSPAVSKGKMMCKCGGMMKKSHKFCPSCGAPAGGAGGAGADSGSGVAPDKTGAKYAKKLAKVEAELQRVTSQLELITKVGPEGFVHGWIKVGDAGSMKAHGSRVSGKTGKGTETVTGTYNAKSHQVTDDSGAKHTVTHIHGGSAVSKAAGDTPADGATGESGRIDPMPAHREPDGAEVEAFESDSGMQDGDSEAPTALEAPTLKSDAGMLAMARIVKAGAPVSLGVLHDLTCAAFHPAVVTKCYPERSLATEVDEHAWQVKSLDLAATLPFPQAAYAAKLGQHAMALKYATPQDAWEAHEDLYKAFSDANPGPGTAPTPASDITPGQFNRGYLSAGHSAASPAQSGPNSTPVTSGEITASQFGRGPLTAGHAAPSPGNAGGMSPAVSSALSSTITATNAAATMSAMSGPDSIGKSRRVFYSGQGKAATRAAMQTIHDHIAQTFPDLCPMHGENAPAMKPDAAPDSMKVAVPRQLTKAANDGEKTVKKAKKSEATAEAAFAEATLPDVTKAETAIASPGGELESDRLEKQVDELRKQAKRQQKLLKKQAKTLEAIASQPDPTVTAYRGAPLMPAYLAKSASAVAGPPQTMDDVAERTKSMMLRELEQEYRTTPDPALREAAWRSIVKMRGISGV